MNQGVRTIVYPVKDITAAKALYTALLGAEPDMDTPYYVGWHANGQDIGLDPNGHTAGLAGPVGYWHVDNITKTLEQLIATGAVAGQPVKNVGGGKLIATVTDADGNVIGLSQNP